MSAAKHTASLEISLRIGQRVRHQDYQGKRVTGIVRGLSVDTDDVLHADIALDEAIVIPPINADDHELRIYRQHVPAHEVAPFDERDELIGEMLQALQGLVTALVDADEEGLIEHAPQMQAARAAIAKATGGAS